ncbi:MAG: DUF1080 domain-containing protein, partial [Verrucomicrobia bacterium]|nr:DUF1080 domain-containing protein [Verrucomicrobiota bacterium]
MKPLYLILAPILFLAFCLNAQEAITPFTPISLLDDPSFEDFTIFLNPERSLTNKREEIWSIRDDGMLHVSGEGWGYIRTNTRYRDYHLVLEYKWGEHTSGYRAERARDNGLLVHAFGQDGAYSETWMNSIEAQLIEGGSGDILVLVETDNEGNRKPIELTAKVRKDRNGKTVWAPNGEIQTLVLPASGSARLNWRDRDPDWRDIKGYRGAKDIENPVGEWNRMEVICMGDTIRILINGELVNEAWGANPAEGYICLQSEGAECFIRRFELWPTASFTEAWEPEAASTNTGMAEVGEGPLPRRLPWSPEQSLAAWRIDGEYDIELVAAEPIV